MSYNNPRIPLIPNAKGLDLVIQHIQTALGDNIPWLEKSFGRAWFLQEYSTDTKTNKFPKCWNGEEYENVLPNDNFKAMSFLATRGQEKFEKFANATNGNAKTRDLALIIWGSLKKIDPTKKYIYTEELKNDVEKILVMNVGSINQYYDEKAELIFQDYTLDDVSTQYLMYPFFAMRFDVTVKYFDSYCTI
jgi:hypothetical protein